ncbi:EamA family transporter [Comamonas sp. Y33R10-2]|uniref:DMT family transporter n=1 Tax=Comamonas sp. Y33R10-2 TaxID=2853257 RepID=UPI001C5CB49D|nr:EamA family transporter [Comamonas sp. Y33R10-2]QXZ08795.1 EamA family transporter [Comamonas sp. Y33R10-2]
MSSQATLSSPATSASFAPIGLVLAAAMLWGTTGTAQHFAPAQLSPYWVGGLRMVMAALFFVALAMVMDKGHRSSPLRWGRVLFCGLCMAVYNLSFFAGIKACGVALGTALAIGSGPIWAGLMQAIVQNRMPSPQWWLGTCIGVGGGIVMALAATDPQNLPWGGMALCLLAGLSYAAYALVNQALVMQARVATVNAWVFGCAALMSLPFAAWLGGPLQTSASGWVVVIYLGMVTTGFAYLLFSIGLRSMSAATGVALSKAEPITAFALSLLIVGERPQWWSVLGLLGVIGGLWLVVQAERKSTENI